MGTLRRELHLFHICAIACGAMISSGIFVLPGLAYARAGPAVIIGYLLAGLLSLPGMLSIAEMATAMPKAGADCFAVVRSMGPSVGTVAGLLSWFSLSMKGAFALVGISVFMAEFAHLNMHAVALAFCLVFVVVNLLGIRTAGRMQLALVIALFALMSAYVALGLPRVEVGRFEAFAPKGMTAVFFVTGYVFIAYGGLLKIASVAEEVRNPSRNIPMGMILSLLVVTVFYTLMVFVTVGVLDGADLAGSLTPISDGAGAFMGGPGRIALSIAAVLAFLTTANAGIMTAARSLVPLSRDRLFPAAFGRINARFGTPHNALLLTGVFIAVSLCLRLELLVEAASIVLVLTNGLACLSVIILRESRLQNYHPLFRTPLYPWLQIAGLVGFGFVLVEMGVAAYLVSAALIVSGSCAYWFYGRKRVQRESALLHLIERFTARELTSRLLETELKEIIRERDSIVKDRFDEVIERCVVLDLPGRVEAAELFKTAAAALGQRLGLPERAILDRLLDREMQSTTVIGPGLAVPHAVVEGEAAFDILIARCREGIVFPDAASGVEAVFVLVGSLDVRNTYLRALAAIAQIAQDPQFERRWMQARGAEDLRDLVLLSRRRREG